METLQSETLKILTTTPLDTTPGGGLTPPLSARSNIGNDPKRVPLLSIAELLAMPPTEWLVEGVLPKKTLSILYGRSGSGKSFVALELALSVASGRSWFSRETEQGQVVYVVAEGGTGFGVRVRGWLKERDTATAPDAAFVPCALLLFSGEDVDGLLEAMVANHIRPSLIVIDTFARCFVGGEENSAKDVGRFIYAIDRLRVTTGATVLVVHHTGKHTDLERGSSALRAAADTMISVTRNAYGSILLANDKQKDAAEFAPISLRLRPLDLGQVGTTCVLEQSDGHGVAQLKMPSPGAMEMLAILKAANAPLTSGEWKTRVSQSRPAASFYRWLRELKGSGLIESDGHRYSLTGGGVSGSNDDQLSEKVTNNCHTPVGVAVSVNPASDDQKTNFSEFLR